MRYLILLGVCMLAACGSEPDYAEYKDAVAAQQRAPEFISNESVKVLRDMREGNYQVSNASCGVGAKGPRGYNRYSYCDYQISNVIHAWTLEARTEAAENANPRMETPTFTLRLPDYWDSPHYRGHATLIDEASCAKMSGCEELTPAANQIQQFVASKLSSIN